MGGLTKVGVAYVGYKSANHWSGALTGLVALRLAEGGNLAGGAAGTGILAIIGLTQVIPPALESEPVEIQLGYSEVDWWRIFGLKNP